MKKNLSVNQNLLIIIKSLVFTLAAIVVLEMLLSLARGLGLHLIADSLVGNVLLEAAIFGVQIVILNKYSQGKRLESIGLGRKRNGVRHALVGSFIGLVGIVLIYITVFASKIGVFEGTGFRYHHASIVLLFIVSLFVRAIFAGVCEEVFFRGVLLQYLAKYKGKTFGLIVSSLIFALFHCTRYNDLYQLSSVLLCGIALGYLYLKTKSLYMSIGLHFATDFFINFVGTKDQPSLLILDVPTKLSINDLTRIIFILLSVFYLLLILMVNIGTRNGNINGNSTEER